MVAVAPADADADTEGHHVGGDGGPEITVTVTSADGSRTRDYRVRLGEVAEPGPAASCLRGAVDVGFSLVTYEGGSVEDLVACARDRNVSERAKPAIVRTEPSLFTECLPST